VNVSIIENIKKLKKDKNAVILAHNYQRPEVQDIADYVGDSLGLSVQASKTTADIIVFCGVHFMAETAAILSPKKKVIMPDISAGCPMAEMIKPEDVKKLKSEYPGVPVVAYVNTTAAVKAEVDYCCTSANAVKVVNSIKSDRIIFIPDKYLGDYVAKETKKDLILFNGFCPTHVRILPEHINIAKKEHPEAMVIAHPECLPSVVALADKVASTEGMALFVKSSPAREFIIATEVAMLHRLRKENPGKIFYPATELATCPNMKKITLEKILWALEEEGPVVTVAPAIAAKAKLAIDRMIGLI
jgi:quinolinate synthase